MSQDRSVQALGSTADPTLLELHLKARPTSRQTTRTRIYSTTLSTTLDDGPDEPVTEGGQQRPAEASRGQRRHSCSFSTGCSGARARPRPRARARSQKPTQGGKGVWACGLAGLLKAQGARLERRGEALNLQKPPREGLKPQARWRAKGRECVRENTHVLFHNPSVGASQSPPKTCGCAALEGQYCNSARAEPA